MDLAIYIKKVLFDLGLSEGESEVYVALVKQSGQDASALKQVTGYSLAGVYKIINSLIEKGLVFSAKILETKGYFPISVDKLAEKFKEKGAKLQKVSTKLRDLNKLGYKIKNVEVYEDKSLVDYYLNIPYKVEDFIWCVGSFEAVLKFFGPEIEKYFIKNRARMGKTADALIFDDSKYSKDLAGRDVKEKRETRIIPCGNYPLEFSYLFGNTAIDFYKDDEGKVNFVKVESEELARARLFQYQTIWNSTQK